LLLRSNCRPFQKPEPNWLVWTDASDYALGGYALRTVSGKNANVLTVDNLLLQPDGVYKALKKHVQLRAEAVRLNTFSLTVRDIYDIDITGVEQSVQCFRPFLAWESAADSNERELIAVSYVIENCVELFAGQHVTVHTDNQNAALICTKGSNKPRLNKYAQKISTCCLKNNITLNVNWITRDLNIVADAISNSVDYTDYSVTQNFFNKVAQDMGKTPVIDLFANDYNTKCKRYFSLTFTKNACGVDVFSYNWKLYGLGWIFVPPPMILRAINHKLLSRKHLFWYHNGRLVPSILDLCICEQRQRLSVYSCMREKIFSATAWI
jgi:hypothetical protein